MKNAIGCWCRHWYIIGHYVTDDFGHVVLPAKETVSCTHQDGGPKQLDHKPKAISFNPSTMDNAGSINL